MSRMFGTNGIRGIANADLGCELALGVGRAAGAVLGRKVAVACDPRTSSEMLKGALVAGLMSVGTDVVDLGVVPTPALQRYVGTRPWVDGGVMVTASHNPPEFNGLKCIAGDGTECAREQEEEIERLFEEGVRPAGWREIGGIEREEGAAEEYVDSVVGRVDAEAIRAARLKAVLDCANGCACATSPAILETLGVETVVINGNPDMGSPGRDSEPVAENLTELMERVRAEGADLGIAHDGDADRVVFVDSDGRYVPGDLALSILGRHLLEECGGEVVVTVATSRVVEDAVSSAGGRVAYTAVGSPVVARRMAADGATFGGEENGGLIFADHQLCRDGGMGAARMLECIAARGSLREQADSLPKYRTVKRACACPDEFKARVTEAVASRHPDARIDRTDGLKLLFDDGWVLLRASGTEPKYRVYSESRDPDAAERRSKEFCDEMAEILGSLGGRSRSARAWPSSA